MGERSQNRYVVEDGMLLAGKPKHVVATRLTPIGTAPIGPYYFHVVVALPVAATFDFFACETIPFFRFFIACAQRATPHQSLSQMYCTVLGTTVAYSTYSETWRVLFASSLGYS